VQAVLVAADTRASSADKAAVDVNRDTNHTRFNDKIILNLTKTHLFGSETRGKYKKKLHTFKIRYVFSARKLAEDRFQSVSPFIPVHLISKHFDFRRSKKHSLSSKH
jgi:hypothetical protein